MMNPAEIANIAAAEQDFWWYRGMREILFRMLDPVVAASRIQRVIEAGCGTGYLSKLLAERYGWTMFPIDLLPCQEIDRLAQATITALPFGASTFDALLSIDVIPHLERGEEHRAFAEFARVLKPGGLLVIRAAAFDFLRSRHSQFVGERQRFTKSHLVKVVERAGFVVERATYANSLLLPLAWFKFRVWEPLMRTPPASGVQPVANWLDRLLYLPLRWEAAWIGRSATLPVGQSLVLIGRKR